MSTVSQRKGAMPQASSELRAKWGGIGGVCEDKAVKFLHDKGWTEHKFIMYRPSGKAANDISEDEWGALQFLIDEWDYGYEEW